tara:strand:+ start:2376 stop:2567 length:192 start_codon:yes stop_codon:yes gene_type:complete
MSMTDEEVLTIAIMQVDNLVTLLDSNPYKNYLYNHLSPIKYELDRQLTNLVITAKMVTQTKKE